MDDNTKEVVARVKALVATKFNGDYMGAFNHYDLDKSGKLGPKDLWGLLEDAGVGNFATRKFWIDGIIDRLDKNKDGAISIPELAAAFLEGVVFPPAS